MGGGSTVINRGEKQEEWELFLEEISNWELWAWEARIAFNLGHRGLRKLSA